MSGRHVAVWVALVALGCGEDEPSVALRIELVPNAAFNTRQEVRAALDALEIVVDGTERALQGLPADPGPITSTVSAENRDADADLELVYALSLDGWSDLPILQFEPGQNGDQALRFRFFGLDGAGEEAAVGQVVVAFQPETIVTAQAPFNLKAAYRSPRVVSVQPDPEAIDVPCDAVLRVSFSEAMDEESTQSAFLLRTREVLVDGTVTFEDTGFRLVFTPARSLELGAYSLEVGTGARDQQGVALDQDPYRGGAQTFASRFTVATCP